MDLTNAKVVVFRFVGRSSWYMADRIKPDGVFLFKDPGGQYIAEKHLLNSGLCCDVRVLEEFPTPSLSEIGDDDPNLPPRPRFFV